MNFGLFKAYLFAVLTSGLGVTSASAATIMECEMNEKGTRGWVPTKIFVQVGDAPKDFKVWLRRTKTLSGMTRAS